MEWNTYRLRFEITGEKENEFHGERNKKKKKGLEGESRRKMTIPTGSDTPISVYMILYYVRMSICL